jgi:cyanophycin synthetase
MKVIAANFLTGPNVHFRDSAVVIRCDLGELAQMPGLAAVPSTKWLSSRLPAALRSLEAVWNEAIQAHGTLVDALLHVALALQRSLTVQPVVHARILLISGGEVQFAMRCEVPAVGMAAWEMAAISCALFSGNTLEPAALSAKLKLVTRRYHGFLEFAHGMSLDPMTIDLLRAASRRNLPWYRIAPPHRLVQIGQGRHGRRLHETLIDTTNYVAVRLASNKAATHQLLRRLGFPQPVQHLVHAVEQAVQAANAIGFPVAVTPWRGSKGDGVSVGLVTAAQVEQAFRAALKIDSGGAIVESVIPGDDHRLLVVDNKLLAAARRLPAMVTGDGKSTVKELLTELNRDPRRGIGYQKLMQVVDIDQETLDVLAAQHCSLDTIPAAGRRVLLRRTANIARGATAIDVTAIMHPDNIRLAEDVARVVGLDVAGIDFLTTDIRRSWREVGGGIIEVNPNPGLRPHWLDNPQQRDLSGPIFDLLLRESPPARIPTACITGSIGKTTTCRMVAHIVAASGRRVGLTTTQGAYIGDRTLKSGDCAGGIPATDLLLDPAVEAGVFEIARGSLIRSGLALDRLDVGAVLNVLDNHLGLDGITTRAALAQVKRLVVENADEMAVLNADDPLCLDMREHVRSRRLCLYSCNPEHPALVAHGKTGGCTVTLSDTGAGPIITLREGGQTLGAMDARDIPATVGGIAQGKAVNAAFAIAIAHGMGLSFATASTALRSFVSSHNTNPGRLNFIRDLPFTALIDWTDGPVATAELAAVTGGLKVSGQRTLLLTAVGNRPDEFIMAAASAIAGPFDHHICSNHTHLRGRTPDAIPALLRSGLISRGVSAECIECVTDFGQALEQAISRSGPDDLLVVASYAPDTVIDRLQKLHK